jgi:imidazolonepropionase-like amidohydrolase
MPTRFVRAAAAPFLLCLGVAATGARAAPDEPPRPARPLAITDATIITVSGAVLRNAAIVLRDGKIAAVGPSADIPKNAEVIRGKGLYIMPGLIDTHSHIGVYALPEVEAHQDGNEWTDPITPHVRALDAIHGGDPAIERAVAGGVTTVQVLPGSANLVGGQSAVLKLRGGTAEAMLFEGAPPGLKMAFGENPKRLYGQEQQRSPASRMGNAAVLRQALAQARDYRRKWDEHRKRREQGASAPEGAAKAAAAERSGARGGGAPGAGAGDENGGDSPPARDLRLEALADLLDGKYRAHVHVYRADDILTAFRIADEFGFKIASLQHCLEGYKVAEEIARRGAGVATFADLWGFKMETWDATPENAARMQRAGVRVAIQTDHPVVEQRYLIHEAARAVRYGLPEEEAYRAVTLNPAWILGIDSRVGSLEPGKDADLAIFDGPPLSVRSRVVRTIIDGVVVYERKGGESDEENQE